MMEPEPMLDHEPQENKFIGQKISYYDRNVR